MDPATSRPAASTQPRSLLVPLVALAALAIVLAYVDAIHGFLATLVFSALAGILARQLQLGLVRRGVGPRIALSITVLAYVIVLVLLAAAAVASVLAIGVRLADNATELGVQFEELAAAFAAATGLPPQSVPAIDTGALIGGARQLLGTVTPAITGLAMSVLIVTYLLLDADGLRARMLRTTSHGTMARFDALSNELVVYMRVRALLGAAAAVADTVLLLVIGVPFAMLWGVVSFLFSFVPNLGFVLALVPPAVFAFLELGPPAAVLVVAGYVAINLAFDYVLQPRVMSSSLDLSPVVVIISILAWTVIIGPAGALLAVPLTIALRVVLVPFEGARWFVALLGPVPPQVVSPPLPPDAPADSPEGGELVVTSPPDAPTIGR